MAHELGYPTSAYSLDFNFSPSFRGVFVMKTEAGTFACRRFAVFLNDGLDLLGQCVNLLEDGVLSLIHLLDEAQWYTPICDAELFCFMLFHTSRYRSTDYGS